MECVPLMGLLPNGSRLSIDVCRLIQELCRPKPLLNCNVCKTCLLQEYVTRPVIKNVPCKWYSKHNRVHTKHGSITWKYCNAQQECVLFVDGNTLLAKETPCAFTLPWYQGCFENRVNAIVQTQQWRTIYNEDIDSMVHVCIPCFLSRRRMRKVFQALKAQHT